MSVVVSIAERGFLVNFLYVQFSTPNETNLKQEQEQEQEQFALCNPFACLSFPFVFRSAFCEQRERERERKREKERKETRPNEEGRNVEKRDIVRQ